MSMLSDLRVKAAKAWPFQTLPPMDWSAQAPTYADADPAVIRCGGHPCAAPPERQLVRLRREFADRRPRPGAPRSPGCRSWRGAVPTEACGWPPARVRTWARTCPPHRSNAERWCARGTVCGCRTGAMVRGSRSRRTTMACCAGSASTPSVARTPTDAPILSPRPGNPRLAAVSRLEGVCEPCDVVANRLDPWHGAWFHPYSFTRLEVLSAPAADEDLPDELDRFLVAVTFQIGRLGVPVIAEFTTPGPRTVVMRIVDGEGQGSVVETHATPLGAGRDGRPARLSWKRSSRTPIGHTSARRCSPPR